MSSITKAVRHIIFSRSASLMVKLKIKGFSKWDLNRKYPGTFFYPHLFKDEIPLFYNVIEKPKVILEYGSGGSTIQLLRLHKKLFSVDSNPEFFKMMSSLDILKSNIIQNNLVYKFIDLGPTDTWGNPAGEEFQSQWHEYYESIWSDIEKSKSKIDLIFIDGRFRVNCCLYSILKLYESDMMDCIIMIHDFWNRKEYHIVLRFLDEQTSRLNLGIFKIRKDINLEDVRKMLLEYSLIYN